MTMDVIYEKPDPMDQTEPFDDLGELIIEEDNNNPNNIRLKDILKRMSSYRKFKNINGGKTYGNKSQRPSRSSNRRRKHK